jgi:ABC-2 type transport system ATP-binding protein
MSVAVELECVTKKFGTFTAVDDLSLHVPTNTIYGFIGPNGSGKTTTLRMIMRIFFPDTGHIRVLGEESWKAASDRVAYLPEERGLYKSMKVREVLRFYSELKGNFNCEKAIAEWLEKMNLSAWADKKVETLSKGMSQKVQFIATVIAKPALILLDEPFSGLDPVKCRSSARRNPEFEEERRHRHFFYSRHERCRKDVRLHLHDLQGEKSPRWDARSNSE